MTITFMPILGNLLLDVPSGSPTALARRSTYARRASPQAGGPGRLAVVQDGYRVYDGPAVLDLIRRWDRRFEWVPGERGDRGVLVHDTRGRLVEDSEAIRRLLVR